jgi:hypothetical protein
VVKPQGDICIDDDFNSAATSPADCVPCFCFGQTGVCSSSTLYVSQLPPPTDYFQLITIRTEILRRQTTVFSTTEFSSSATVNRPYLRSTTNNDGVQVNSFSIYGNLYLIL